jgi:two-component system, OmpR family, phosphate regulon response regulator PhoB
MLHFGHRYGDGAPMGSQILVVQPDRDTLTTMRAWLEEEGNEVLEAADLAGAGELAREVLPDAILVHWTKAADIKTLVESAGQRNGSAGSCILVTATQSQMPVAISALEAGADDCLRLPTDRAEFIGRIKAGLRRRLSPEHERLTAGSLVLDKAIHCLCIGDQTVNLAPTEFRLLSFFMEHRGRVFSREEILRGAWKRNIQAGSRTVDVHVRRLRQVLEPFGCADMIQTVRSFGYRFNDRG